MKYKQINKKKQLINVDVLCTFTWFMALSDMQQSRQIPHFIPSLTCCNSRKVQTPVKQKLKVVAAITI